MNLKPSTGVPAAVADLVTRFSRDRKVFLSPDYKREQLRAEFLKPFFESLGWDVYDVLDTLGAGNCLGLASLPLFSTRTKEPR